MEQMVSDQDTLASEALAHELQARGVLSAKTVGAKVPLSDVPLEIHAHEAAVGPATDGMAATVIYDARASGAESTGVCVLVLGFGASEREAMRDAAMHWCMGVYPTLTAWLTQKHVCEVGNAQMIVALQDSPEQFGWRVHLGPVIARLYGKDGAPGEIGPLDHSEFSNAVFNSIHPFAAHRTLFWLECFAVRYHDGKIDATCRLHNDDWEPGRDALLQWTATWPERADTVLSKRQFLMFEPVPVSSLLSNRTIQEALETHPERKPWWKRLFAGA